MGQLGQGEAFSSGGGASVENPLPLPNVKSLAAKGAGRVLDVKKTLTKFRKLGQRTGGKKVETVAAKRVFPDLCARIFKPLRKVVRRNFAGVYPDRQRRSFKAAAEI